MPANYVLLGEITVSVATTSVTFSNIPQTGYTDLIIKSSTRADGGFGAAQFNGDTGANYSSRFVRGNGSTAASSTQTVFIFAGTGDPSFTANEFASAEMIIPNYSVAGINKVGSTDSADENNGATNYMPLLANYWTGTAAISSIRLYTQSGGSFAVGSSFYVYGVAKLGTSPVIAPKATGGDIVVNDGTYWYHAFLTSGIFTPSQALSCDALVVAGGGGGGTRGAGGAGGYRSTTAVSLATATSVTVGAGGAVDANGSNSVFSITSTGGGKGATNTNAGNGGSGGGGYDDSVTNWLAGSGNTPSTSPSQGNNGGAGSGASRYGGGGGGGAGAVGGAAVGGAGGVGGAGSNAHSTWASVTGTGVSGYYAGGGGGGNDTGGAGGAGGGGTGATSSTDTATAGTANTGGGGGAGRSGAGVAKAGGSGIVIVRYTVA